MKQVAIMTYKIKKVDHDKVVKAGRAYLDYEFANPYTFLYTNTSYYFRENTENPEEEIWMFIDYFDNYEDYDKSLQQAVTDDPIAREHHLKVMSLKVPNSLSERQYWTDVEEFRVDFKPME